MNTRQFELVDCTCVHCGISFQGHFSTLYCSERCRLRQRRIRQAQRRQTQPVAAAKPIESREWNGTAIQRRSADGFVNATAMAKANGKHLPHYMANERTREYLEALAGSVGIPTDRLTVTTMTGPNDLRGTWVHPRLAVDLARWISPAFAVWMDGWFLESIAKPQPAAAALPAPEQTVHQFPLFDADTHHAPRRADQLERVEVIFGWIRNLIRLREYSGHTLPPQHLMQDVLLTLQLELYGHWPMGQELLEWRREEATTT